MARQRRCELSDFEWSIIEPRTCCRTSRAGFRGSTFSAYLYKERSHVEGFFNKLRHFRAVATRFEKSAANYLNLVKLA